MLKYEKLSNVDRKGQLCQASGHEWTIATYVVGEQGMEQLTESFTYTSSLRKGITLLLQK